MTTHWRRNLKFSVIAAAGLAQKKKTRKSRPRSSGHEVEIFGRAHERAEKKTECAHVCDAVRSVVIAVF